MNYKFWPSSDQVTAKRFAEPSYGLIQAREECRRDNMHSIVDSAENIEDLKELLHYFIDKG